MLPPLTENLRNVNKNSSEPIGEHRRIRRRAGRPSAFARAIDSRPFRTEISAVVVLERAMAIPREPANGATRGA